MGCWMKECLCERCQWTVHFWPSLCTSGDPFLMANVKTVGIKTVMSWMLSVRHHLLIYVTKCFYSHMYLAYTSGLNMAWTKAVVSFNRVLFKLNFLGCVSINLKQKKELANTQTVVNKHPCLHLVYNITYNLGNRLVKLKLLWTIRLDQTMIKNKGEKRRKWKMKDHNLILTIIFCFIYDI